MKHVDEYRNADAARRLAQRIAAATTRDWTIMEVCGGQTHTIVRYGIDELLPPGISLVHGPGCPVCVTPVELIDKACQIAALPGIILCSFGDMLRVPGSKKDLLSVKATGGDVRIVYSPMDALELAANNPKKHIVFFAVGFETTVPATAATIQQAARRGIDNFSILVSHVLVPPAIEMILSSTNNRVQGFLAAGHVCTVMGTAEYEPIAEKYNVPIVVTGFEPIDILHGVDLCVRQLEEGRAAVENAYARAVRRNGNSVAQDAIRNVFRTAHRTWRGIGEIAWSGLELHEQYRAFDANNRFGPVTTGDALENSKCISGAILRGERKPHECPTFENPCTPERPLGAPMVSSEGACAAYHRYRRHSKEARPS